MVPAVTQIKQLQGLGVPSVRLDVLLEPLPGGRSGKRHGGHLSAQVRISALAAASLASQLATIIVTSKTSSGPEAVGKLPQVQPDLPSLFCGFFGTKQAGATDVPLEGELALEKQHPRAPL